MCAYIYTELVLSYAHECAYIYSIFRNMLDYTNTFLSEMVNILFQIYAFSVFYVKCAL